MRVAGSGGKMLKMALTFRSGLLPSDAMYIKSLRWEDQRQKGLGSANWLCAPGLFVDSTSLSTAPDRPGGIEACLRLIEPNCKSIWQPLGVIQRFRRMPAAKLRAGPNQRHRVNGIEYDQ
ncbi:hypothetical protein H8A95_21250 [Bradyrhizobium sp. Pear76]|uniref:hypothetical protein n=1 Tax=Bradyrhizobium oropedii TaxID=1571201 RepID=UPI001E5120A1|nr:hypothetical protein [Bradyrhizobium oropedii]MCC8964775.1 hypothetical protein [Bradyrhizobium oropedii]